MREAIKDIYEKDSHGRYKLTSSERQEALVKRHSGEAQEEAAEEDWRKSPEYKAIYEKNGHGRYKLNGDQRQEALRKLLENKGE